VLAGSKQVPLADTVRGFKEILDLIPAVKELLRVGTYVSSALQGLLPESGDCP